MNTDELLYITIAAGESLSGMVWNSGESVTVAAGGTLTDSELTYRAASLTLESGAAVTGTLTVGTSVTVEAGADLSGADLVWEISRRKKEASLLWSDISAAAAGSITLSVSANQNKGTYRLAGNAAGFDGTITVMAGSAVLGTLSLDSDTLDFDVTRYTLGVNDAGELTVTVSSNITDEDYYVFLYKDNQLVTPLAEGTGLEVSGSGEYDHLVVIEDGLAGNIKILSGGVVTVYSGAAAVGIVQDGNGRLRFDYTAGDSTVITGANQYGTFVVKDDELYNVHGENVTLSGALKVVDYHSNGVFTAVDGVDISGIFVSGTKSVFKAGTIIHDCSISGSELNFESGITVTGSTVGNGLWHYFRGGTFDDVTISGAYTYLYGGTYSDVTLDTGAYLYGNITLAGTLTVRENQVFWGGFIDAAGNTIVLDYTGRTVVDSTILDGAYVSEDAVFCIDLLADQGIGTYKLLANGKYHSDYDISIRVDGNVLGTLTQNSTSFEYGNYVYTVNSADELLIDLSPDADETFNVLYWRDDWTMGHAADLFSAVTANGRYRQILVRKNGIAGDITLDSGGILTVNNGGRAVGINHKNNAALRFDYAGGDSTVISGVNQYGMFLVSNDLLLNVVGEYVNLTGAVSVRDYHSTGNFTANDGVAFSGVIDTGGRDISAVFGSSGDVVTFSDAVVSGYKKTFYTNTAVTDSVIGGTYTYLRGGTYTNVTVNGSYNYFYGGTFSDSVWYSGYMYGAVELAGTLTIRGNIISGPGVINANGNTIILDYTQRTVNSGAIISLTEVSEDVVFDIALRDEQTTGTYTIASGAGSFIDTFNISIDGDIIGTLDNENAFFEYGNFSYLMSWDNMTQNICLTIGISENADERFNVLCYNSNNELFYASEMTNVVVDGTACAEVVVRNGGWLADTKLNKGTITVRSGANVYGLEQAASGKLEFNYAAGDTTIISGVNQYGTFVVKDDHILNAAGDHVTVTGDVVVEDYHAGSSFTGTGITVAGTFYGNGSFAGAVFEDVDVTGTANISGDSTVTDSTFYRLSASGGNYDTVTVTNTATLSGGTYSGIDLAGGGSIRGRVVLDGMMRIGNTVTCVSSYSVNGAIDAAGYEVNLDLTRRSPISDALINLDRVYNGQLSVTVYANQTIGTYALGSNAGNFGQGDGKGYWDIDTNKWLYTNAVEGDLDGIITIRSDQGVELARCTVNGDTEYFGRYNYRVYTDENDILRFRIGWNNREDITYTPDGYDNDTMATAVELTGNIGKLEHLTIDSASDVDWYKFSLAVTGRAASSISIDFKQWAGDLEMNLYDAAGNLVDYAQSVTDNEELSLRGLAAGDYYLKVFGHEGNTNQYSLNWNLPQTSDLVDAYEKGNDKAHSHHLGKLRESVSVDAAISDANDEDWFMFILDEDGTSADSISITFDDEEAELEFYIYGSNGKDLIGRGRKHRGHKHCHGGHDCHHKNKRGKGHGRDDDFSVVEMYYTEDEISLAGFKHGVYYVRVVSADGGAVNYTLNANMGSREVSPDKWENNDSRKRASNLYSINGESAISGLSIHSGSDVDYFKFKILEDGSVDDYISIDYEAKLGDLDLEILDRKGNVVAYSRTAENTDTASLNGLKAGEYYIRVSGYEHTVNNYELSYNFTNSKLIASDVYEPVEDANGAIDIRQSQTISDLSIAMVREKDETRADTFRITLDYDGWKSSKIILTDYRSDWEGLNYVISTDAEGKNVIASGISSEISLAGFKAGEYYLTVDAPVEDQYSKYSVIAQHIPDSTVEIENTWSIFVYIAGDNNLEGAYLTELLYMQHAILPENVEVYVLMDRHEGYSTDQRNWTDTRVGKIRHSPGGAVAVEWMYFEGVDTDTYMNTSNLELMQEWDTGDIITLESFLDWGMQTGRADNYALIMKDHGTSLGWNCSDETSNSMLSITEISDLLKQDKYDDISVVAFDQCLMGSDVVITEMEEAVDYVVASESVGWTPNLLMMYKVLFNSLETDMTPEELAGKMVESCNCSGRKELTLASFDTSDTYLSTALNDFASHAAEFTYADWVALCSSFGTAFNYGDNICAFSDLLSILKEAQNFTVSAVFGDALNELIADVSDYVIKTTQITPAAYGTGLAVFNPVLSSDNMSMYCYSGGGALDYYGSKVGQMAWGDMLYTVGKLADDVSEYISVGAGKLTFHDFYYFFGEENKEVVINLGAFSGSGVTLPGLYVAETARFNIEMLKAGIEGDAIRIVADDPDANITISLAEVRPHYDAGGNLIDEELIIRRISENGVLSLAGVDFEEAKVYSDYSLVISTDKATTYTMIYEGLWTSGVDRFDFARTGSLDPARGGNNILDKSTHLTAGNYAGLMTYSGDADYYQLNTVYADDLDVTVFGSGLTVREYDADGDLIQTAVAGDGQYVINVKNGNYLYIEGDADISANMVNSYYMEISDVESTYMNATLIPVEVPTITVAADVATPTNNLIVDVAVSENAVSCCSTDLITWTSFENGTGITVNGRYYFKAVDTESGSESNYTSLLVENIDTVAPDAPTATVALTGTSSVPVVTVTAVFSDDSAVRQYRIGDGDWLDYTDAFSVTENAKVYFRAVDAAGNESTGEIDVTGVFGGSRVCLNGADTTLSTGFDKSVAGGFTVTSADRNLVDSVGDFNTAITGGTYSNTVNGGDYVTQGYAGHDGDINLTISGGIFKSVGGGMAYTAASVRGAADVYGDINLTISGGTFNRRVYGGNISRNGYGDRTLVDGDINITIDSSENNVCFNENIVAGSFESGRVEGNVSVVFTGSGEKLSFTGIISGGSGSAYYIVDGSGKRKYHTYVSGSRGIVFSSFDGDFKGDIKAFTDISFADGCEMAFTNSALNFGDISSWEIGYDSSVAAAGANDFAGDTLNIDVEGWNTAETASCELVRGAESFFEGWDVFSAVTVGGTALAFDGAKWAGGSYELSLEDDADNRKLVISFVA